jgi:sulfur carrier protein
MRVTVNGQVRQLPDGLTVAGLIDLLDCQPARVAVERNRRILRRGQFQQTLLAEDDVVEVVTLVGGG